MIELLSRLFIKNRNHVTDPKVRQSYGMLCGTLGIILNILMFSGKYIAGVLTASIAITADAFNNLSDAGSSIITLFGFKLAGQAPDPDHPYGHGRMEYISGFIVSAIILLLGFEMGRSSIEKIIMPEPTDFNIVSTLILITAILIKGYMGLYNRRIAQKIDSAAMKATAADCIGDMVSTTAVLLATLAGHFFHWQIDGWCGLLVSLFLLYSGYNAAKDTLNPLLGQPATSEFVHQIEDIVLADPTIAGIHDLIVHDYGPGRKMISLHAEVPMHCDILAAHDIIDNLEKELQSALGCTAVIHMDPIATDDAETLRLHNIVADLAKELDASATIHDFRMVRGNTHTNLIFDVVLPFRFKYSDKEAKSLLQEKVRTTIGENYYIVVNVDKPYV